MIPPCSWSTPGRKPGTSTSVTSGMLNASQVCTNRAAFSLASMSSTPARTAGWFATMPTTWPSRRGAGVVRGDADDVARQGGERAHDVGRPAGVHLEELAVVHDFREHGAHVV